MKIKQDGSYTKCVCENRKTIDFDVNTGKVYLDYNYINYLYYDPTKGLILNLKKN
jgi:hypothetical protein